MTDYASDIEQVLLSAEELDAITERLAGEIRRDYENAPRPLVLVCVLKGSIVFTADLMRKLRIPVELECIKASSYGSGSVSSGTLKISYDINRQDYKDLDILLVEDIVDSGRTLSQLTSDLRARGARSVRTCSLLDKPSRRVVDFSADYVGRVIPDAFVVGYGLDYDERYRNLPYVGILKKSVYT